MSDNLAVVFDCGATKLSVAAVNDEGTIVKSVSYPNAPIIQPGCQEDWKIWDLENIWLKLCLACRQVCTSLAKDLKKIKAVTACTFGADGAPVSEHGSLTYPVISWHDRRTIPLVEEIKKIMDPWEVFVETGYQLIHFNTFFRLMWLKKYAPEALSTARYWLMMPGLLSYKLCGEFSIDPTIGGTMMAMSQRNRDWSTKMLSLIGLDPSFFPSLVEPGDVIGYVDSEASKETGLPEGTPVVAAGHDTQFAALGSGADENEAILSSGTWEILMLRTNKYQPTRYGFSEGILIENDAVAGFWNPQLLMMGSGVVEWIRKHFYKDLDDIKDSGKIYEKMIEEGWKVDPGSSGVMLLPCFVENTGPAKKYGTQGTILGLNINTERGQIYRAALEGLSFQLKHALDILSEAMGIKVKGIHIVGGGAKNALWNQIRADVIGLPVTSIAQKDATSIGAAMVAFKGAGVFSSIEEALRSIKFDEVVFEPSQNETLYKKLTPKYMQAIKSLQKFYLES